MQRKSRFLIFVIASIISSYGFAQSNQKEYKGDENRLRICIQWNDSTEYQTPELPNGPKQAVYKFKCRSLFWGIYEEREIYVATNKESINKFNSLRELGRDYFWSLRKTESTVDGAPVYYHYGAF